MIRPRRRSATHRTRDPWQLDLSGPFSLLDKVRHNYSKAILDHVHVWRHKDSIALCSAIVLMQAAISGSLGT